MYELLVPLERVRPRTSMITKVTRERLLPRVGHHMLSESVGGVEGLATFGARVVFPVFGGYVVV